MTRTRIRILGSGSVKKFHQNRKCKWFRIRTWSGSANHTKLNANASGSGFLNPDSGIFMRTPDSHRIRTITVWIPSSGSDWARTSLVCKGTRHLDHPWGAGNAMPCSRTNAIQVRQVPNLLEIPCLPLPSCGKLPWIPPAWKGIYFSPARGFGVSLRMTRCRG